MPWYEYEGERGLDSMARMMPALDQDAVERVEWDIIYGIVTEPMAEHNDELNEGETALSLDPRYPHDSRIPMDDVLEVQEDIIEAFYEEHKHDIDWDIEKGDDFRCVAVFEARWLKQKGEWKLTRYDFEMDVDPSTEYPRYDVDEAEAAEA